MIIGVTGLARAGKDTFADYLVRNYGFVKFNMSDCLRDELISAGKDPSKMNMSILGDEWRTKWGYDIVIRRTLKKAQEFSKVVITGFRSAEEVDFMRDNSSGFMLIAVLASEETRFRRRVTSDPQDFESFIARDRRDIEMKGLDKVLAMADEVVENESHPDGIYRKIDDLFFKD